MHRLFVALELPPLVRDALLAVHGGVAGARWQRDDQLHLTLRFIGEVDRHQAQDVSAALGSVNIQRFALSLGLPGTFDRRGRIDTLWVGVTPQSEVGALAKRVDSGLLRIGLPPETRAFGPHMTVARFSRIAGPLAGFPAAPLSATPWDVTGFALWESRLGHDGADYAVIERYGSHYAAL
ncbi:RNA 2',3'-cyclic phosphodiesterase [Polymorphobacter multimanifer]|uniref:RNA 2',3'-cyclic phosphodiesterase n=1 Tax=Polymorphobacter multimanifer TaxID=1070431 RepID=UPI001662A33B|nr:RNA 2',3'-cyclic phosphodiesterase [Polymorphobacter multimanifer]GGI69926.1 RNA 2',3'-cyclic phosphodiesterase [Polymorphobacter multimanifer]